MNIKYLKMCRKMHEAKKEFLNYQKKCKDYLLLKDNIKKAEHEIEELMGMIAIYDFNQALKKA